MMSCAKPSGGSTRAVMPNKLSSLDGPETVSGRTLKKDSQNGK